MLYLGCGRSKTPEPLFGECTLPSTFGTDGWRDIIAEDFTYANLRLVAQAHAQMLRASGGSAVVVGFDPRFQGHHFARVVAETMAQQGLNVWLAGAYLPTPALSFAALHLGAAGGVMITASYNPPIYNGYKLKGPYGGSATPEMVARVEAALARPESYSGPAGKIQPLDIRDAYFQQLDRQLDLYGFRLLRVQIGTEPTSPTPRPEPVLLLLPLVGLNRF